MVMCRYMVSSGPRIAKIRSWIYEGLNFQAKISPALERAHSSVGTLMSTFKK